MYPYGTIPTWRKGYCKPGKRGKRAALDSGDESSQRAAEIGRRARAKRQAQREIEASLDDLQKDS
jgi:hypothetical protein